MILNYKTIKKTIDGLELKLKDELIIINDKLKSLKEEYYKLPETAMKYQDLKYIEELNNKYFSLFTEKKIEYVLSNAGYSSANRILKIQLYLLIQLLQKEE